ncbi:MAG: energy transducer TonB [Candidatus Cryptobacteroides sp.]
MDAEDRAGLYITVIFHLVVVIVLLVCQLGAAIRGENTFVLDFSKEEELQKEKEEQEFKESVSQRLDELIASSAGTPIRNIAVDRGTLKDDRNTDAEQLYKDAEKLAKDLQNGYKIDEPDEDYAAVGRKEKSEDKSSGDNYSGPSVVSYELEGRKASRLSIPAYRCLGSGHVTVLITVDPAGNVINAKVQEGVSSDDRCLRDFAVRAARLSKFSVSKTAPARQMGNIVYMFVAQ